MKKNLMQRLWMRVVTFIPLLWFSIFSYASVIHASTKSGGTTTGTGSFNIATTQTVRWTAMRPFGATGGDAFWLSKAGPNQFGGAGDILLDDNIAAGTSENNEVTLSPGLWFISINTLAMGEGTYTIEFNLAANCDVTPLMHSFGNHDAGSAGINKIFAISLAGDMLDVEIGSISGTDNTHFVVSGGTGTTLRNSGPTSVNFTVRFEPGLTAGTFSSTITIVTTNSAGVSVPDKTITVTGTTVALVPNIDCVTSGTFDFDWLTGVSGNFNKSFENGGNAPMTISSISFGANPSGVFAFNGAPGTTNLPAGSSRAVSIRFTPPDGEVTYTGSLIIISNSPGETAKECFFTARAHHPEPNMVLSAVPDGATTINYHDVEIGFTFTKAIKVRNTGDAPLNLTLNLVDPADPDPPQWSEINEPNNVTIAAGTEQIFLQRFKPTVIGTYSFEIQAHGTGGGTYDRTDNITLTGNGISPVPMDNVLVLDRSGSMSESAGSRTKIDALQKAGRLYYDLLRPDPGDGSGDQIGMVKYNSSAQSYLTPLQQKNMANEPAVLALLSEAATTDGSRLQPSGGTCISCGMTDGANLLLASPDTRKQIMVVMTDGKETAGPGVSTVLDGIRSANPDLKIYSLGLGNDINEPLLQSITNAGAGGYHHVSEDLLGASHFALEEFYFKIYANASGADLVVDPTEAINLSSGNPVEVNRATIVSSDRYAIFMVLDDPALASYYSLEFIDPHGTVLDPSSNVGGVPIQILKRSGHIIYKIIFPDISQANTYVGDWVLRLNPTGKWKRDSIQTHDKRHGNYDVPGEWIHPYQGVVPIGFGAAVKSDYNMNVAVTANNYEPGAQVLLTAQLSDRGWPSTGGQIEITATKPDASDNNFKLFDDGTHGDVQANDGTYSNSYNQTSLEGSYRFFFNGKGINERGELVPRQATRYVSLFKIVPQGSDNPKDPGRCFPCWMHWISFILLLVLLWVIIRCCRKKTINRIR